MLVNIFLDAFVLKVSNLKENRVSSIEQRIQAPTNNLVPKSIISCWIHIARMMKVIFNSEFMDDGYQELQKCLQNELIILLKVIII